jgi:hypothetical protein
MEHDLGDLFERRVLPDDYYRLYHEFVYHHTASSGAIRRWLRLALLPLEVIGPELYAQPPSRSFFARRR